ncbi:MAG: rhomboid family intramembrane serine protease [Gemmatimonadetes bacterium]|nr:rhomboid family intramembrane serine protease [Gemmatimonadota bacterium]
MRYTQQPPGFGTASVRFHMTPWVKALLIANGIVFLVTFIVGARPIFDLFAFSPARIWSRPWGMVTYMFLHAGFWHLLMNCLFIFFFGPPLESRWGSNMFIRFYLICGLGGVLLSFAFSDASIVGASAACYGIMLAFAMIWPNTPVYIWGLVPVKVKWLVIFLVGISFLSAMGPNGGGIAHLAHLGGAIAGFLMMKSGWLPTFAPGARGRCDWGPGAGGGKGRGRAAGRKKRWARWWGEITGRADARGRRGGGRAWIVRDGGGRGPRSERAGQRRDARRAERERAELDKVDAVLDKISEHGINALTPEERDVLDRVSRQTRAN